MCEICHVQFDGIWHEVRQLRIQLVEFHLCQVSFGNALARQVDLFLELQYLGAL